MMRKLRALWMRLRGLFSAQRDDCEFEAELESHVAMHTVDGIRAGLSPSEARRQALIRLGGAEQTRQAYRERRTLPWLESLGRDLAYSLRRLARQPALTAIAVFSIGLGIGANATIFSMVSRFILRPAPVGDPATLVSLEPKRDSDSFSLPLYKDLRDQVKSFSGVAAYFPLAPASVSGSGEPERVFGETVTTNFFDVAQLRMTLGRGFASSEEKEPVAVLSTSLWQRRFHGDPAIVGKTITLSGHVFTVVGVAPADFHSIEQILDAQFFVPIGDTSQLLPQFSDLTKMADRDNSMLSVFARLRPGVTRAQAAAELNALAQRLALSYPKTDKDDVFSMYQAGALQPGASTPALIFLSALSVVVLLVLAIAGANVANLLFA
ncbi:MAG: ABC transporter permease, partial [Terracidiphilus sp.]